MTVTWETSGHKESPERRVFEGGLRHNPDALATVGGAASRAGEGDEARLFGFEILDSRMFLQPSSSVHPKTVGCLGALPGLQDS